MARPANNWFHEAADRMVRERKPLRVVAMEMELGLTSVEADKTEKSENFRRVLNKIRNRFYSELGNDPEKTKAALIGRMLLAADELFAEGEYEKGADVVLKLAKVEGIVGAEGTVNVFGGLSAKDIDDLRTKLQNNVQSKLGSSEQAAEPIRPN